MFKTLVYFCLFIAIAFTNKSDAAAKFDQNCSQGSSLRQTLVFVDVALLKSNNLEENTSWTRTVVEMLDALEEPRNTLAPYEHIALYSMDNRKSDLEPFFSGCSPTLSAEKIADLKSQDGSLCWFVGCDAESELDSQRESYRKAVLSALSEFVTSHEIDSQEASTPDFSSLKKLRNLVDIGRGLPRIIFLVDESSIAGIKFNESAAAKLAGIESGRQSGFDLQRAEVHVVVDGKYPTNAQQYFKGMFLATKGNLFSFGNGLPVFGQPAKAVYVFNGIVKIDQVDAPVNLRIAVDEEGILSNSWIETSTGRFIATPFSGRLVCGQGSACRLTGDGQLMGQSWNPEESGEFKASADFGWSGLRYIEADIDEKTASVRIYDPKVDAIRISDGSEIKDFRFKLTLNPNMKF